MPASFQAVKEWGEYSILFAKGKNSNHRLNKIRKSV